jgi:N-acylneuraminate cytidylyltransferase
MRVLGVIPARGGSKGLPRKNVLPLAGRPLIAWTIACAKAATSLTRIIVSTDDAEIAAVSRAARADVPFMRPAELATDTATSMDMLRHALGAVESAGDAPYDAVCLLQPTSPFRHPTDIDGAIALIQAAGSSSVISVSPLEHPLAWTVLLGANGELRLPLLKGIPGMEPNPPSPGEHTKGDDSHPDTQRQAHATAHRLNGAVYVYRRPVVLEHATGLLPDTRAWVMADLPQPHSHWTPTIRGIDIDTAADLNLASAIATGLSLTPVT